ncbi:unnamed protein product, partial [Cylicocyclus nassatus]
MWFGLLITAAFISFVTASTLPDYPPPPAVGMPMVIPPSPYLKGPGFRGPRGRPRFQGKPRGGRRGRP